VRVPIDEYTLTLDGLCMLDMNQGNVVDYGGGGDGGNGGNAVNYYAEGYGGGQFPYQYDQQGHVFEGGDPSAGYMGQQQHLYAQQPYGSFHGGGYFDASANGPRFPARFPQQGSPGAAKQVVADGPKHSPEAMMYQQGYPGQQFGGYAGYGQHPGEFGFVEGPDKKAVVHVKEDTASPRSVDGGKDGRQCDSNNSAVVATCDNPSDQPKSSPNRASAEVPVTTSADVPLRPVVGDMGAGVPAPDALERLKDLASSGPRGREDLPDFGEPRLQQQQLRQQPFGQADFMAPQDMHGEGRDERLPSQWLYYCSGGSNVSLERGGRNHLRLLPTPIIGGGSAPALAPRGASRKGDKITRPAGGAGAGGGGAKAAIAVDAIINQSARWFLFDASFFCGRARQNHLRGVRR